MRCRYSVPGSAPEAADVRTCRWKDTPELSTRQVWLPPDPCPPGRNPTWPSPAKGASSARQPLASSFEEERGSPAFL